MAQGKRVGPIIQRPEDRNLLPITYKIKNKKLILFSYSNFFCMISTLSVDRNHPVHMDCSSEEEHVKTENSIKNGVAQGKRAGLITQRSEDRNLLPLIYKIKNK